MKFQIVLLARSPGFLAALILLALLPARANQGLIDFHRFDMSRAICSDASARVMKSDIATGLEIRTGHQQSWPGVSLLAPAGGRWNASAASEIALEVFNPGPNAVTVYCRVDNPGADGTQHCVTGS